MTWLDLLAAALMLVVVNLTVGVLLGVREGPLFIHGLAARLGYRPGEPPEGAKDLWMGIVGQRREDAERRRRSFRVLGFTVIALQWLPVSGWFAGPLTLSVWVALDAFNRSYDRVMLGFLEDDALEGDNSLRNELWLIAKLVFEPSTTNPMRGRWRGLGIIGGAASVALALIGWIGVFGLVGADLRDVPNVLSEIVGANVPVLAVVSIFTILLARLPLGAARRVALSRPDPAREYQIVFLRSFQDDGLKIRARGDSRGLVDRLTLQHRHGYEQLLVAWARHFGPVVAIGQPGERVPPVGGFRRYYDHDAWHEAVEDLLRDAKLIVLSVGNTPSVGWEIAKIRELDLLDRSIFLIPPVSRDARTGRLELLASQLEFGPTVAPPAEPGVEYVGVMFERGQPVPLVSAGYDYASYGAAVWEVGAREFDV